MSDSETDWSHKALYLGIGGALFWVAGSLCKKGKSIDRKLTRNEREEKEHDSISWLFYGASTFLTGFGLSKIAEAFHQPLEVKYTQ